MKGETAQELRERREKTRWKSGLPETICGKGSMIENTEEIREWLPQIIHKYNIRSIADVGCGDQNWIHKAFEDVPYRIIPSYTGYDIKPRFVDVKTLDVTREILPEPADLVMCIYVLNHLYPDQAETALRLLKMSGSKYLLMSYSSHDEYALLDCELVESMHHKTRKRDSGDVEWRYGLWRL